MSRLTSIPIWKDDHQEFLKLELGHSHKAGRRFSHPEFFNVILNEFKKLGDKKCLKKQTKR